MPDILETLENNGIKVSGLDIDGRSGEAVADPYYGDEAGFEVTWAEVVEASRHLARRISRNVN